MKIGLDFDDVTVNFFETLLDWYNKKYNRNDKREQFNAFAWNPVWEISPEEAIKRVDDFHENHKVKDVPPMPEAIESLKVLMKKHELIVITGRPARFKHRVEEWLLHHLGTKLQVFHAGEFHKKQAGTKAQICKELGISILIEDAPGAALDCAKTGINVILFDSSWNQGISHKNMTRVKNWKEAMIELKKIEAKK